MLKGKKVYICSPLSADTDKERAHNMDMARFYLERMSELYHCRTFASHAHFPLMIDDSIQEEREAALAIGRIMLDLCDALLICGRRISAGMSGEIRDAFEKGKEVYWYDSDMKPFELEKIHNWEELSYAV